MLCVRLRAALAQHKWEVAILMISSRFRLLNIPSYRLMTILRRFPWICAVLPVDLLLWEGYAVHMGILSRCC